VLVGHFGSGKTEIALNGALELAGGGVSVTVVDLDVVKPYFRSRSAREILAEAGIGLIAPAGENVFADLPIVMPQIRTVVHASPDRIIVDVGGDDSGATVLGSLADVVATDDTDCLLVLNFRRPFTGDLDSAEVMIREIESASKLKVTGLVSNTHLMAETDVEIVLDGYRQAAATASRVGVPLVAVTVEEALVEPVRRRGCEVPVVGLRRVVRAPFDASPQQRTTGPLFVLN
jgi:hypothetical protein